MHETILNLSVYLKTQYLSREELTSCKLSSVMTQREMHRQICKAQSQLGMNRTYEKPEIQTEDMSSIIATVTRKLEMGFFSLTPSTKT